MAIFGRITARQRLRRATRESLTIPAFSSPVDCTPWVTGGLWPAELSTTTAETATLAEYLKADLQRITRSANDELRTIQLAGMPDFVRQAEEARVIDEARARAVRRVESTIRQLHAVKARGARRTRTPAGCRKPRRRPISRRHKSSPPSRTWRPPSMRRPTLLLGPRKPSRANAMNAPVGAAAAGHVGAEEDQPDGSEGRHRASDDDNADEATTAPRPEPVASPSSGGRKRIRRRTVAASSSRSWSIKSHA